jgi:hypothetical protein
MNKPSDCVDMKQGDLEPCRFKVSQVGEPHTHTHRALLLRREINNTEENKATKVKKKYKDK